MNDEKNPENLCRSVLGLENARGEIAEKIASTWRKNFCPKELDGDALLQTAVRRVPFWVMDVETTGMNPPTARVIEIAGVEVQDMQICRHFATLLNPGVQISGFIFSLTGITDHMLRDAPAPQQVMPLVESLLSNSVLVAHNAAFDRRFIDHEIRLGGGRPAMPPVICTVRLARRLMPRLKNHNLDSLARAFGLSFDSSPQKSRHRALGDAMVTAKAFIRMMHMLEPLQIHTVADLARFQNMPYKTAARMMQNANG